MSSLPPPPPLQSNLITANEVFQYLRLGGHPDVMYESREVDAWWWKKARGTTLAAVWFIGLGIGCMVAGVILDAQYTDVLVWSIIFGSVLCCVGLFFACCVRNPFVNPLSLRDRCNDQALACIHEWIRQHSLASQQLDLL